MQNERSPLFVLPHVRRQGTEDIAVIAVFTGTNDHPVIIAISHQGAIIMHQIGTVVLPRLSHLSRLSSCVPRSWTRRKRAAPSGFKCFADGLNISPIPPIPTSFIVIAFILTKLSKEERERKNWKLLPGRPRRSSIPSIPKTIEYCNRSGIRIPKELGGQGGSEATIARVYEELARVDIGFTGALAVHNNVTIAVSLIENSSLRDRYLHRLISGEAIGAFLLTEPGAGSDATSIQTLAAEKNDQYIINGTKACGNIGDVLKI